MIDCCRTLLTDAPVSVSFPLQSFWRATFRVSLLQYQSCHPSAHPFHWLATWLRVKAGILTMACLQGPMWLGPFHLPDLTVHHFPGVWNVPAVLTSLMFLWYSRYAPSSGMTVYSLFLVPRMYFLQLSTWFFSSLSSDLYWNVPSMATLCNTSESHPNT